MSDVSPADIRFGTDADGPAVGRLVASVFAEYPDCPFVPAEFPELAAVASHYRKKGGEFWIAERGGVLVGTFAVMGTGVQGSMEFAKVYLAKTERGRGLAARLLGEALTFARERGTTRLELFTDTRFSDGHRFYERHGFVRLPGIRYLADEGRTWEYHYERSL